MSWGKHLIVDARACRLDLARDPEKINAFAQRLIDFVLMKSHGPPLLEHFGEGELAGWTLVQLITTSNLTLHFLDHSGDLYLDLFTCGDLDPVAVEMWLEVELQPVCMRTSFHHRQA